MFQDCMHNTHAICLQALLDNGSNILYCKLKLQTLVDSTHKRTQLRKHHQWTMQFMQFNQWRGIVLRLRIQIYLNAMVNSPVLFELETIFRTVLYGKGG